MNAKTELKRTWILEGIDRKWSEDMVAGVLQQHFRDFQIIYRKAYKSESVWYYKTTTVHSLTVQNMPITTEDEDGLPETIDLWARLCSTKETHRPCRAGH